MANAELVSIGSELLLGQIVDTNAAWMAQRLTELGVNLFYKTTVGDNRARMRDVIARALDRSDVLLIFLLKAARGVGAWLLCVGLGSNPRSAGPFHACKRTISI